MGGWCAVNICQRLIEELQGICGRQGAFLGVADLGSAATVPENPGGEFVRSFPRAVSIGIRINQACAEILACHSEKSLLMTHLFHVSEVINKTLDLLGLETARHLEAAGHRAFPVPAEQLVVGGYRQMAVFSHKLAARLAGLGWIGKNSLLIHPIHGPRVRLVTVLTDAPLPTGTPVEPRCGTCRACERVCPVKAIIGHSFSPDRSRENQLNVKACVDYRSSRGESLGVDTCGLCLQACPYGAWEGGPGKDSSAKNLQTPVKMPQDSAL